MFPQWQDEGYLSPSLLSRFFARSAGFFKAQLCSTRGAKKILDNTSAKPGINLAARKARPSSSAIGGPKQA
jgi:hypothetical protein